MGGLLAFGIVLTLMGLSIMSGLMQVLMNITGNLMIGGGIIAAVVGGVSMLFGGIASKVIGLGLLMLGIAVAVIGLIMRFVLHLWFLHWVIEFGGGIMLIIGIILAIVGLVGLLKGGTRKTRIHYDKGRYIEY